MSCATPLKMQQLGYHNQSTSPQQVYNFHNQTYTAFKSKSKVSPSRRLKNMLKPLLLRVFKSKAKHAAKRSSYIASEEKEAAFEWLNNDLDNLANEQLENRLIEELHQCEEGAAIFVYDEDGTKRLEAVDKEDFYVPVHFARTDAGTFFWTSMQRETIQPYQIEWHFLDRWAQA